jgi:hypothetical protein
MFNRGHQYVSEDDLERDLESLHPSAASTEATPGQPLTRARRTISGFFFVHVAQTDDDVRAPGRRTYEFMHAFAEYLVAEQTTGLLRDLADDWRRSRRRSYGASLDERVLRALLSHQPLISGDQVLPFLIAMLADLPAENRRDLRDALLELFRGARTQVPDDPYRPTAFDAVNRAAAYTANLALLAAVCDPDGLAVSSLCDPPDAPSIESTVRLWRSGLDPEAQLSFFRRLHRVGERFVVETVDPVVTASLPVAEARLIGDLEAETVHLAGELPLPRPLALSEAQRDFHLKVVRLLMGRVAGGAERPDGALRREPLSRDREGRHRNADAGQPAPAGDPHDRRRPPPA